MTDMVPAVLNGEFEIVLPRHRAERPEWYTETGWEKARLAHMRSTTQPGDRVLYIGAEEGEMCALLQMWGAQVFLVEPNELVWPNIRAIWDANNLPAPAGVYAGFCGRQPGENHLDGYPEGVWPASADGPVIGDHGFKELRDPGGRPITSVDGIGFTPEMISLDVEGAEWEVLQGAEFTINAARPRIYLSLHPEFLFDQYGGKYSFEVRRWIIEHGYREELLDWQHEGHLVYEPL